MGESVSRSFKYGAPFFLSESLIGAFLVSNAPELTMLTDCGQPVINPARVECIVGTLSETLYYYFKMIRCQSEAKPMTSS